jgi:hypothetical protein
VHETDHGGCHSDRDGRGVDRFTVLASPSVLSDIGKSEDRTVGRENASALRQAGLKAEVPTSVARRTAIGRTAGDSPPLGRRQTTSHRHGLGTWDAVAASVGIDHEGSSMLARYHPRRLYRQLLRERRQPRSSLCTRPVHRRCRRRTASALPEPWSASRGSPMTSGGYRMRSGSSVSCCCRRPTTPSRPIGPARCRCVAAPHASAGQSSSRCRTIRACPNIPQAPSACATIDVSFESTSRVGESRFAESFRAAAVRRSVGCSHRGACHGPARRTTDPKP